MFDPPTIGPKINTEDEARNWVMEIVAEVEGHRQACDFAVTVGAQHKAFMRWMIKRGEALGVLQACWRLSRMSDATYDGLRTRVLATQVPTVREGVLPVG
jgi:hypothetical protein